MRFPFATAILGGLLSIVSLAATSCSLPTAADVLGTSSLTGTYTGVLQKTGKVPYVSLDQTVTVAQSDDLQLSFTSSAFPSFNAVIIGTGTSAATVSPVGYSGSTGVQLQEIAFTKDSSGEWVLIIQSATGLEDGGANADLVQFASYDPKNAPPESADLAVQYLDQMFALAGATAGK